MEEPYVSRRSLIYSGRVGIVFDLRFSYSRSCAFAKALTERKKRLFHRDLCASGRRLEILCKDGTIL